MVVLESKDGHVFGVDVETLKCSAMLMTLKKELENRGYCNNTIPLPIVRGAILKKVIQWAHYHKYDPPLKKGQDKYYNGYINKWDRKFMNVDVDTLYELLLTAHQLEIKGLYELACRTVANKIKGKTPEQIRKIFHIENDLPDDVTHFLESRKTA